MPVLDDHIKRINDKLQLLLRNHQALKKNNERQSKLIAALQAEHETNQKEMASLREQLLIVKAAAGQMTGEDKKAFEKNLSQYIRDIDKCIGLLSE